MATARLRRGGSAADRDGGVRLSCKFFMLRLRELRRDDGWRRCLGE